MPKEKKITIDASKQDIAHGRTVLFQEIKGLQAIADSLGQEFAQAVDSLGAIKGRVIVSGMGKSGHVARKVAATLASTGTPAMFVHPGEASHGDLGMITPDDAVLALSNSGETAELSDLIAYCKRFKIPLVAMVRRKESMLVKVADVAIVLPEIPEACPTGAPTTSTTMMMALGDALSVALVERKGFTKDDFSVFHPGGNLGKAAFTRVKDLMHTGGIVPVVDDFRTMDDVLLTITEKAFGCTAVVDPKTNKLVGIITDGDIRRHMKTGLLQKTAAEVMHPNPLTIRKEALAVEALAIMNEKKITSLFIVNELGLPEGILHIHDCLRAGIA